MPRYIVKIKEFYLEWSTVVDAPVTFGMPLNEFQSYYLGEYGLASISELEARLRRVDEKGVSAKYANLAELLSDNRAGPNETNLSVDNIYCIFCLCLPTAINGFYHHKEKGWTKKKAGKIQMQKKGN